MAIEAKTRMTRVNTLETALKYVTNDRNVDNGNPEDNFLRIAEQWTFWLREKYHITFKLTPTDVAMMSLMIKIARLLETETKHDNWIDIAGYAACGAETASIEALDKPILRDAGVAYTDEDGIVRRFDEMPNAPLVETGVLITKEDEEAINVRIREEMAAMARISEGE